jgi:hypothetical protein
MINIASGGNASKEWWSFGTLGEEFDTILLHSGGQLRLSA